MRKLWIFLLVVCPLLAFAGEPLMFIKPSRETFINFPSAILPDKAVTVFLPEPAVPLHRHYPVVYILGAIPKDAPQAQEVLERSAQKAILVGINVDAADLADTSKLTQFFVQDLVPYIEANYSTIQEPAARAVAARGADGARAAAALMARKDLIGRAMLLESGTAPVSFAGADEQLRMWIGGSRAELVTAAETLTDMGKKIGTEFVTKELTVALHQPAAPAEKTADNPPAALEEANGLLLHLPLDYLFAPAEQVRPVAVKGEISPTVLSLHSPQQAQVSAVVTLANRMQFDYIPLSMVFSPLYLQWDAQAGQLSILNGAEAGKVKISIFVDKQVWRGKIKLKK